MREPADERSSSHTCAHHSREDPALAVFDRLVLALEPFLQDGHAASPVQRASAAAIFALPLALHHAPVIVAVHLQEGALGPPLGRLPLQESVNVPSFGPSTRVTPWF